MTAPIREAFVVADPQDPTIAGVPLVVRTIIVLERAGIERVTVVGQMPPADRRIHVPLAAVPAMDAPTDSALRLVVGPGAVIDGALVRDVQARARPTHLLAVEHRGARVWVAPGPLISLNGGVPAPPRAGVLLPATAPAGVLERALLRGLENAHDGYLDRILYRRLSRPLTRLLLRTSLSPNVVTLVGIAIGIVGGSAEGRRRRDRHADARVHGWRLSDHGHQLDPRPLEHQDGTDDERDAGDRRIPRIRHDERLPDGRGHPPMRGRTSRSARSMSSGKSISVHGIPSTRSKPTGTRARRSA